MRYFLSLGASLLLVVSSERSTAQPSQVFSPRLDWGRYGVGFRVVEQYDPTRVVGTRSEFAADSRDRSRGRPIQTLIWYPAQAAAREPLMRFRDYAETYTERGKFPRHDMRGKQQAVMSLLRFLGQTDSTTSLVRQELAAPVHATMNAPPIRRSFPVIIYGPGSQGPAIENAMLGEYLASHGYIFIATPSWGPEDQTVPSVWEPAARDLEFLVAYARSLSNANVQAVALMGHSYGGIANVVAASRNPSITAVVSLEGTVAYVWSRLKQATSPLHLREYAVPSLFITQSRDDLRVIRAHGPERGPFGALSTVDTSFLFFDSLRYAPAYVVELKGMRHRNFCSLENQLLAPGTSLGVDDSTEFNPDRVVAARGYEIMSAAVIDFLDVYVKRDSTAHVRLDALLASLTPEQGTVASKAPWPDLTVLVHKLAAATEAEVRATTQRLRSEVSGYTDLDEAQLGTWTLQRDVPYHRMSDAVAGAKVLVTLYPDSAAAQQTAGYIARDARDTAIAISHFRRALELDPSRAYLKSEIARLQVQRPH